MPDDGTNAAATTTAKTTVATPGRGHDRGGRGRGRAGRSGRGGSRGSGRGRGGRGSGRGLRGGRAPLGDEFVSSSSSSTTKEPNPTPPLDPPDVSAGTLNTNKAKHKPHRKDQKQKPPKKKPNSNKAEPAPSHLPEQPKGSDLQASAKEWKPPSMNDLPNNGTAPADETTVSSGRGSRGRGNATDGRGRGRGSGRGRGRSQGKQSATTNHQQAEAKPAAKAMPKQSQKDNEQIKDSNEPSKKNNVKADTKTKTNDTQAKAKKSKKSKEPSSKKATSSSKQTPAAASYSPSIPPNQPQQTSPIDYGRGKPITVLHVAEKPSIGTAIAHGLRAASKRDGKPSSSQTGNNNNNNDDSTNDNDDHHHPSSGNRGGGGGGHRSSALPVHTFTTTGRNTGAQFPKAPYASVVHHRVTSVAGHVYSLDFGREYQSWDSVDPAELFEAPVIRQAQKSSVVRHLADQARNVDFIVLWMDCDREGENINFEVLDCCMHLMQPSSSPGTSNYDRVYRAYFSAITPSDIYKAYLALGKPDKNQSLAVDARQELDLKVGVAFSRFQTRFFQGRYGDLDSAVLSYGPCQTPTLGFCVQRHVEIETFRPEPYWTLELGVLKRGRMLRALWGTGRSFHQKHVAGLLEKALTSEPLVKVTNVVIKDKKQGRPIPLNTVALLKACSKALGIGPHSALQNAERLYLSGYLSYPRTETTTYPASFDIEGTLREQSSDNRWGSHVRALLKEGFTKSRGGFDAGDHPPITPCRAARPHELVGDMARVYDLVVRHFIASVSDDAVWRSTRVEFDVPSLGEKGGFTLQGKELVSPGFLAILMHKTYGEEAEQDGVDGEEERSIPEFTVGELIPLVNTKSDSNSTKVAVASGHAVRATLEMKEKMTTPPSHMTESELIGMMEKYGIGTDASISTHIENVQKRNYVSLASGRRLLPTKLGLVLVQGYHQIDSSLVLPQARSDIENQCNKIAVGQASKDAVVRAAIEWFRRKYEVFVNNIDRMDVLFGSSFLKLEDVGKPFTRCGLTRRYLQFIAGPPARLYNKWTESVYPLPGGGVIKQWSDRYCIVKNCKFELCLYSVGQPQRSFPLCPRCYNDIDYALDAEKISNDPIERADEQRERQMKKPTSLVLECPLPDRHPLIEELTVSPDPDSSGSLILDPQFGPKWRLVSTRSPTIIYFPQSIQRVTVLEKRDEVLGIRMMSIEFKDGESPLPDGSKKYTCSFASDEMIQGMVRVYHGSDRLKASGRGRGRGRGRGGRGRGRA